MRWSWPGWGGVDRWNGRRRGLCGSGSDCDRNPMTDNRSAARSKVPAITLGFWIIKILATTLGETGGDTVSMTWLGETPPQAGRGGLKGYLVGTAMFGLALIVLVWLQIRAKRFNPWLYGATIVAST